MEANDENVRKITPHQITQAKGLRAACQVGLRNPLTVHSNTSAIASIPITGPSAMAANLISASPMGIKSANAFP
jgi:hypothetical protein